jgi:nicotinamide-nucleotide amidase
MSINKLHKKLIKNKITISVAESCTGGLLSSKLTTLSGSSKYFKMGLITYSNNAKINILNVNKKVIDKYGAVSQECCRAMVENLSKLSKSKINVSITGVAGPKGGTKYKPIGLVFIGIKAGNKIFIIKNLFGKKNRSIIQSNTVKKCINLLIKII